MGSEASIRLFLAALVPLAVVAPLRLAWFGDSHPMTVLLLGPAFEESVELAATIVTLALASLVLRGGRDPALALRYWLFLAPWIVGGLFGLAEGLVVYPGQGGIDFTLREFAHATFVALSVAAVLGVWRRLDAPYFGVAYGFVTGLAAHTVFNTIAFLSGYARSALGYQFLYLAFVALVALVALAVSVRESPGAIERRTFLRKPTRRVHP